MSAIEQQSIPLVAQKNRDANGLKFKKKIENKINGNRNKSLLFVFLFYFKEKIPARVFH
jgi:hypothetical protein